MIEGTKERWFEPEANRIAGEIALMLPDPDAERTHEYYDRALAVAPHSVAPVDRNAAIPEVIIRTASEKLPVNAITSP
jgi:hypothetical protein